MERKEISKAVLKRLPGYLAYLKDIPENASPYISATALANALGMSEAELLGEDDTRAVTKKQLKLALFGDADVSDKLLDEVIRYAKYIKSEGK